MCLSLRWDGLDGCVKSLLHVYFHTRADGTPSSVSSLSAGPAHASVHFSHDHFHTWFSVTIVPRNLRNNTKMQPLKAEAYVVQNIYRTHNNKLLTGGNPVEVWSKTTNKSRRQRSNEQTTTPRCAGTRRSRGRERWEGKAQNKVKWRLGHSFQQEHQREEQLSFHFINLNLPTMLRFCRNSMHACMHECPFLTFTGKCIPHTKGHTNNPSKISSVMSQLWNILSTAQTLVHFPPINATLRPPTTWNTCLAACPQLQRRVMTSACLQLSLLPPQTRPIRAAGKWREQEVWRLDSIRTWGHGGRNVAWSALPCRRVCVCYCCWGGGGGAVIQQLSMSWLPDVCPWTIC